MPQPPAAFLESLIDLLTSCHTASPDTAEADLKRTLAACDARTPMAMLNAARLIAFSLATLETLADSRQPGLSPAMKIRYRDCALGLNQACIDSEHALTRDRGHPSAGVPAPPIQSHRRQSATRTTTGIVGRSGHGNGLTGTG